MADGSTLDGILKQFSGGLSAGPGDRPDASVAGGVSPMPSPAIPAAVAPANVKPVTTQNGFSGVLDAFKASGGLIPQEYTGEADKILNQIQAANAPAIQAVEKGLGQRNAILSSPIARPVAPQLQGMPMAPDTRMKNPLNVFQNVGTVLAMLGSAFTRRPMVTAMNAAAAAIKGYAEGDKDAAQRAHESWKDSLQAAIAQNQAEMDQYNLLLENTKLDYTEREAQLQGIAASNSDQQMLAALRSGAPEAAFKILDGRQAAAQSLTQLLVQAQQQDQQMAMERERLAESERHDRETEALTAGRYGLGPDGTMAGGGPLDPQAAQMLAKNYISTGQLPSMGYGAQGVQARKQVFDIAAQMLMDQGGSIPANKAQYTALTGTLKNVLTYANRTDMSMNALQNNLQIVQDYMAQGVGGSPSPVVNNWLRYLKGQYAGDPDVTAFDVAVRTAAREYGRVMSGAASNAQLPVSATASADEILNPNQNPAQLEANIAVINRDVDGVVRAANDKEAELIGKIQSIGQGAAPPPPKIGDVQDGHRFNGGDPADPNSWSAVQ